MRLKRLFSVVDSHTVGEPARIVVGGIPYIPGNTMFDKKRHIEEQWDDIRQLLMYEPRGHSAMSGAIFTQPTVPGADIGLVFIEVSGCLPMCGHDTIAACTVLLETGILPAKEPVTDLVLDTLHHPALYGRVHAWLLAERSLGRIAGGPHDTLAWVRLAAQADQLADGNIFTAADALWIVGLDPAP